MGFIRKKTRSALVIDIGSGSVGGAYVHVCDGEIPVMTYTLRSPIERKDDENVSQAMVRTLKELAHQLAREGAPTIRHIDARTHTHMILVSIAAPWQERTQHTVTLTSEKPFTLTNERIHDAVVSDARHEDRIVTHGTVLSGIVDGIPVEQPLGKRAVSAHIAVSATTIDRFVADEVRALLHTVFHAHHVELVASMSAALAVFADIYPLQKEYILLDTSGSGTDIAIVRKGTEPEIYSIPFGEDAVCTSETTDSSFIQALTRILESSAQEEPLPRVVYLLADEHSRDMFRSHIETSTLGTLWNTSGAPLLITLTPAHTARLIHARGHADGDMFLSILGVLYRDHYSDLKKPVSTRSS